MPSPDPIEQTTTATATARRALIWVAIAAVVVLTIWLVKAAVSVFLMAFAAILVATLLGALAEPVMRFTRLGRRGAIVAVILALLAFGAGLGAFIVPSFAREIDELANTLPEQTRRIEAKILDYRWGRMLLNHEADRVLGEGFAPPSTTRPANASTTTPTTAPTTAPTTQQGERLTKTVQAAAEPLINGAGLFAAGVINAIVGVLIVLAAGIYLAIDPDSYRRGLLLLFPRSKRELIHQTLLATHHTLRWWLIAQAITMLVIGTLTGVGLWLIGVRLWFTFAILAALFNFVPNFGPLVSFVPAILFALADPEGGHKIIWITILYVVAQTFEGYILTPLVQKRAVDTPPALLILFQVLAGLLMGPLGLMLAAPLLAATVVWVKMLYVRQTLGEDIEVEGLPQKSDVSVDPTERPRI